jgi:hypothetical protein
MSNFAAMSAALKTEDQAKLREPAAAVVGADVDGAGVLAVGGAVVGACVGGAVPATRLMPSGKKPPVKCSVKCSATRHVSSASTTSSMRASSGSIKWHAVQPGAAYFIMVSQACVVERHPKIIQAATEL